MLIVILLLCGYAGAAFMVVMGCLSQNDSLYATGLLCLTIMTCGLFAKALERHAERLKANLSPERPLDPTTRF